MQTITTASPTPRPAAGALLRLRGIDRFYETRAGRSYVLHDFNLDIEPGEFISIMGPSGAGKSTLLNVLGLLDTSFGGEYHLAGEAVHALKPRQRAELAKQHIGFVFQQYHLLDELTVAENLDVPLDYRGVRKSERQALVADALDRFGIVAKKDLFPGQLSGGQQQLVAVARATIARPAIILADEPTGSLHSSQGTMIMELLRELNRAGTTIIQVTHSEVCAAYGSRVIQLRDGWVRGDSAPTA